MEATIILTGVIGFLCLVIFLQCRDMRAERREHAVEEKDLLDRLSVVYTPAAFQMRHGATIEAMQTVRPAMDQTASRLAATRTDLVDETEVGVQTGQ